MKDSDLALSDVTTNNVSTSKHGFAPKAPNDSTKFLDGTGAYSTPAGGSTGVTIALQGSASDQPTSGTNWCQHASRLSTTGPPMPITTNSCIYRTLAR